ncbi:MAG: BlaI/MecI/CopY family transcriptional regulator [Faecousia sp.]
MNLTKNEIEIMDAFWEAKKPLSRADLLDVSIVKTWKPNSVHVLINSLLKKGALCEVGFVRSGKTYGRTFAPVLTCEEYHASTVFTTTRVKPELEGFLAAVLNRDDAAITAETLDRLTEVIQNKRAALG